MAQAQSVENGDVTYRVNLFLQNLTFLSVLPQFLEFFLTMSYSQVQPIYSNEHEKYLCFITFLLEPITIFHELSTLFNQ